MIYYSVNVYFYEYDADEYFLYSELAFEKKLDKLIPVFNAGYSEAGMQGDDYINLDVTSIFRRRR